MDLAQNSFIVVAAIRTENQPRFLRSAAVSCYAIVASISYHKEGLRTALLPLSDENCIASSISFNLNIFPTLVLK